MKKGVLAGSKEKNRHIARRAKIRCPDKKNGKKKKNKYRATSLRHSEGNASRHKLSKARKKVKPKFVVGGRRQATLPNSFPKKNGPQEKRTEKGRWKGKSIKFESSSYLQKKEADKFLQTRFH